MIVLVLVVLFLALLIGIFVRSGRGGEPKPRFFDIRCKHCRKWIDLKETECPHCQRETGRRTGPPWIVSLACDFVRPTAKRTP
jgi:hypothetical protein